MKKKMAIVLSAILACSMGMTAMAAPSPSIVKEPVAQVVVSPSVGTSNTVTTQAVSVSSDKSAVLPGTTFKTYSDPENAVKTFRRYCKCKQIYRKMWEQGKDLRQLTVSA